MQTRLFESELSPKGKVVGYAQVALEQGIDAAPEGLTYGVPVDLAGLAVGERVLVPLGRGNKLTAGYVVGLSERTSVERVKPIRARDAHAVSLTEDLIELARWMAAYYCSPLGMVFSAMLPAAVKRGTGRVVEKRVRDKGLTAIIRW